MSQPAPSVLVADALSGADLEPLRAAGITVQDRAGLDARELAAILPGFEGLLVRSRTRVTAELLERPGRLRVIGRAGVGVDNIDLDAATRASVVVMNTPQGNVTAAAEHTIALLFALCRHIPEACAALRAGRFEQKPFLGVEIAGKTLGVVGLGRIGREVARRARALGMRVIGYDPLLAEDSARDLDVTLLALEELLREADVVTLHVPATPATRHLIDRARLAAMKRGARLLNVARGGIVDEQALLDALERDHLAGAALDVFESEPPAFGPLIHHPKVVATPHLGASTVEAQAGVARQVALQVADFLTRGVVENAVNMPGIPPGQAELLRPWASLARRLGGIATGLLRAPVRRVVLTTYGETSELSREFLCAESLFGLLRPYFDGRLGPVNARLIAGELGLLVSDRKVAKHRSFQGLLRVAATSASGETVTLDGTLFGRDHLRLVRAFGVNMDAIPEGSLLFVANQDRPGVIAHLSQGLAAAGINIASMSVGRDAARGEALAVLSLDQEPGAGLLELLSADSRILWVRHVPRVFTEGST
jgi:D-3-phosphoglycerate dehydrogenase